MNPEVRRLLSEHRRLSARYDAAIFRHFQRYRDGSASRARTTTFNAYAARTADRLRYLRQELARLGVSAPS